MNIYQRINEVRKSVSYAQKDKKVDGGGYMAVTHDAVTAILRNSLIEHGIVITCSLDGDARMIDSTTKTARGIPIMRYEATYAISFVNVDEPQDIIRLRIESHALDNGDKAPGKAISYAVKYAMLKLFSIETGEDEEGRAEQYAADDKKKKPELPKAGGESAKTISQSDWDKLPVARQEALRALSMDVLAALHQDDDAQAYQFFRDCMHSFGDATEQAAFNYLFDASQRRRLKAEGERVKAMEAAK